MKTKEHTLRKNKFSFLQTAIKSMRTTGAVWPSSEGLIRKMLSPVHWESAELIVELGAGSGAITRRILSKMRPDATLLSYEINPDFHHELVAIKDPRLKLVFESAEALPEHHLFDNAKKADAVISALPLAIIPFRTTVGIINAIKDILTSRGVYVQFQYSLHSHAMLKRSFNDINLKFELINIPPAVVYVCHK